MPIRLRVTLVFTAVMAIVLGGLGLFIYLRVHSQTDEALDQSLETRLGEVSTLIAGEGGAGRGELREAGGIEQDETFAQLLDGAGRVVDATVPPGDVASLSGADLERASAGRTTFDRRDVAGVDAPARLLASPIDGAGAQRVLIVGIKLDDSDEALHNLLVVLLIGGPVALLLASLAGYGATAAALRPVEAMRKRAAAISSSRPDERLPVSEARDELARLGRTLNAMLGRLEEGLERERRFVDEASHELRTPLALHKTELELALRYGGSEEEWRAAISSAIEEVDRLIRLAEDLLMVARSEGGSLPLTPEPLRVRDLFGSVRERFRARGDAEGRPLRTDVSGDLTVAGDRRRLEQALTAMVDNALSHGAGEVRLDATREDGGVRLRVSDDGPGFAPDFIGRAFERFSREDANSDSDGRGLGLAIVETIARAHRGRAGAENRPGGGADVWIELPSAGS